MECLDVHMSTIYTLYRQYILAPRLYTQYQSHSLVFHFRHTIFYVYNDKWFLVGYLVCWISYSLWAYNTNIEYLIQCSTVRIIRKVCMASTSKYNHKHLLDWWDNERTLVVKSICSTNYLIFEFLLAYVWCAVCVLRRATWFHYYYLLDVFSSHQPFGWELKIRVTCRSSILSARYA